MQKRTPHPREKVNRMEEYKITRDELQFHCLWQPSAKCCSIQLLKPSNNQKEMSGKQKTMEIDPNDIARCLFHLFLLIEREVILWQSFQVLIESIILSARNGRQLGMP